MESLENNLKRLISEYEDIFSLKSPPKTGQECIEALKIILKEYLNNKNQTDELQNQNEQYELLLQKLEGEIRQHIRIQQQLKLHADMIQEKLEILENQQLAQNQTNEIKQSEDLESSDNQESSQKLGSSQKIKELKIKVSEYKALIKQYDEKLKKLPELEKQIEQLTQKKENNSISQKSDSISSLIQDEYIKQLQQELTTQKNQVKRVGELEMQVQRYKQESQKQQNQIGELENQVKELKQIQNNVIEKDNQNQKQKVDSSKENHQQYLQKLNQSFSTTILNKKVKDINQSIDSRNHSQIINQSMVSQNQSRILNNSQVREMIGKVQDGSSEFAKLQKRVKKFQELNGSQKKNQSFVSKTSRNQYESKIQALKSQISRQGFSKLNKNECIIVKKEIIKSEDKPQSATKKQDNSLKVENQNSQVSDQYKGVNVSYEEVKMRVVQEFTKNPIKQKCNQFNFRNLQLLREVKALQELVKASITQCIIKKMRVILKE